MTEENENVQDRDDNVDTTSNEQEPKAKEHEGAPSKTVQDVDRDSHEDDVKAAKEAGVSVEEFERTRKALAKANEEAKDRRLKLREYEELGVDPDTVKKLIQEQRDKEIQQMEEEKRYSELLDKMREESNQKIQRYEEDYTKMKSTVEKYVRDNQITDAIAREDGVKRLLEGIVRERTKVVEEDGDYRTVVLDEYGQPSDMSVHDLVKSFKDDPDLGYAFKAPKVSGNGTNSDAASKPPSSKPGPKKHRLQMSQSERAQYIGKHGFDEYMKLPE